MKKSRTILIGALLYGAIIVVKAGTGLSKQFDQHQPGICFIENKGQIHDQYDNSREDVLYTAIAGDMAVHIKNNGVSYQLYRVEGDNEIGKGRIKYGEMARQTIYRVDLTWLNANKSFTRSEDAALPGYNNYYSAACPKGALYVRSYSGVNLQNIYNGITVHYYQSKGELKHDYIVAAHADYRQIQLKVEGAEISLRQDGSLLFNTALGTIEEGAPVVYQNGKYLRANWIVKNNTLSFNIENYDARYELVIDPITRVWGTYYSGAGYDLGGCQADASGNVFLVGSTTSSVSGVIATVGSHQSVMAGPVDYDAFLVKFNGNGVRQWGTYYGGAGSDGASSCAFDPAGNIFLAGGTSSASTSGIVTPGCHQPLYAGGPSDGFLVKFDAGGVRQWATYYGGGGEDGFTKCFSDVSGNVYVCGETSSPTSSGIASAGCHQPSYAGGLYDAFLVKFDGNGVRQWGTYYGGTGNDYGNSCVADTLGNIYMAGDSQSSTGIATAGSYLSSFGNGTQDAYLVKFNSSGIRQWGTYYAPGSGNGECCAIDIYGFVYMSGATGSTAGIATPGVHQPVYGGASNDAYLVKFDGAGVRQWGTYYGGTGNEYGHSCSTDALGNVYLQGRSTSTGTAIATPGSHQVYNAGNYDAFIVKFNANGIRYAATFFGGLNTDNVYSCSTDPAGNIFIAGYATPNTGNIVATAGCHQSTYGGGNYDAILLKFSCATPAQPSPISGNTIFCNDAGSSTFSVSATSGVLTYSWSLAGGWSGTSNTNTISAIAGASGVFSVTANNDCGSSAAQTLSVTVSDCTGIDKIEGVAAGLRLYPNPSPGIINLDLWSDNVIIIRNALGQTVYSGELETGSHQINMDHLPPGIYVLEAVNGPNARQIKIIKE